MALETSIDESKWRLQGGGSNPDGFSSTFQRRDPELGPDGKPVYTTKQLSVSFVESYYEYKYYALTAAACVAYVEAHPELSLQYSRQSEFSDAFTMTKRVAAQSGTSFTLADVPETGA
jgi:hypothetical protein